VNKKSLRIQKGGQKQKEQRFAAAPGGGPQGDAAESLEIVAHGVVASGVHEVVFV